jgi:hypothetical protein
MKTILLDGRSDRPVVRCARAPARPGPFEALTSVDGRLIRSFAWLVRRPGDLTVAYLMGQRKPYLGPVPLFFMANVLFFAVESLLHGGVFSSTLAAHLSTQPWSDWARTLVAGRIAALGTTVEAYAPAFDAALALHARSLIILMALSFAPLPWVAFYRKHKPFVAHAVFSLHLYAFLLLLLCVADVLPALAAWPGSSPLLWRLVDNGVAIALLIVCGGYLHVATKKVYGADGAARVLQVAVLTVGVGACVLGYRFALFLLTLYTTP